MTGADDGPVLVDTDAAAEALRVSSQRLEQWAEDGMVTPAAIDAEGQHRWNLHDLRRELADHLEDREP